MKQTLHDYIKDNEALREALLAQEGGIMKYWAEHPEADFNTELFEGYEKQIEVMFRKANERNRAVDSLSERELKLKAREWYHHTEKDTLSSGFAASSGNFASRSV